MRLSRWAAALGVAAVTATALVAVAHRPRPVAFPLVSEVGGVVDLATGEYLKAVHGNGPSNEDDEALVVPFRAGQRLRVPVILSPEEDVEVLDIRVDVPATSAVRAAGAVIGPRKYVLEGMVPFHRTRVAKDGGAFFGVDVELCCLPRPGWVEVLRGVRITYRHAGRTWTAFQTFGGLNRVVVTG